MKRILTLSAILFSSFISTASASVLDDKFQDCGGASADFNSKFTLNGHQTPIFEATDLDNYGYKIFNAPCIDTYDVMGWGIQIKLAANITLQDSAREKLRNLLGQEIPGGQVFQFIIQKSNSYDLKRADKTTNGGIQKGQQEPISLKAQYVYTPHVPKSGWHKTTIDGIAAVTIYSVAGTAILDSSLIDGNTLIKYPQRRSGLSLHSAGTSSTLSPDTFHLYRGGAEKPATLDTKDEYPPEAYARLIKNEDKTKALLYKVQYENWTRKVFDGPQNQPTTKSKTTALRKEADRYGIIVMLSDADFAQFVGAIEKGGTLRDAITPIGFFSQNVNGVRLMDILENSN